MWPSRLHALPFVPCYVLKLVANDTCFRRSTRVFAADIWHTMFAHDPMNEATGRTYRHMVLEKGGSQDEMKTLVGYLGRKPNPAAYNRELGL